MYNSINRPSAIAYIRGGNDSPELFGEVRFFQKPNGVLVVAKISNLPRDSITGFFGFHIHEGNACTGEAFSDTASHYNPTGVPHPRHAGDLPPLISCNGDSYLSVMTDRFNIDDIIGRTVVIHSSPDDFTSQPAGNAGQKIACGVIQRE